ncbi:MAG: tetratricopeptide repeat protein, partial [Alphaproteobacteria bacterium]
MSGSAEAEALHAQGIESHRLGRHAEACDLIERAVALDPDSIRYRNNLGVVRRALRDHDGACSAFEDALLRDPTNAGLYANLGRTLFDQRRFDEAAGMLRKALLYDPADREAQHDLARALLPLGELNAALDLLRRLVASDTGRTEWVNSFGVALVLAGDREGGRAAFEHVLALDPDYAEAHVNLAHLLLLEGDLIEGFREHEWRLRGPDYTRRYTGPRWQGEPLLGRRILLWAEQGLGDALQFLRYAPMVAARGGRVTVQCGAALHRLAAGVPGVSAVAEHVPDDGYELQIPLMSLPLVFDAAPASQVPYLPVPEAMSLPGGAARRRVGLVWAGNPRHSRDRERSRALAEFAPLAGIPGVALYSLQKGPAAAQKAAFPVVDLGASLSDMYDTASALAALDLLIAVDTSVAHLAGALGRPVWLLLPHMPDWRWGLGTETTPWYPTMRLFREDGSG